LNNDEASHLEYDAAMRHLRPRTGIGQVAQRRRRRDDAITTAQRFHLEAGVRPAYPCLSSRAAPLWSTACVS